MSDLVNLLLDRGAGDWEAERINKDLTLASHYLKKGVGPDTTNTAMIRLGLESFYKNVCPDPCNGFKPEFWESSIGQLVAEAQYWLFQDELVTTSQAAELLFGAKESRHLMAVRNMGKRGEITAYRKPDCILKRKARRGVTGKTSKGWLYRRTELEALKGPER